MTDPIGNAKVASDLAAAGFSVFPCHAGGEQVKRPMPGVFWRSASTTDHVKVSGWWRRWPEAAVGLDLAKSGLLVVDADRHGEDDGVHAIAALMHENGFDPNPVPTVATPNQGTHFYFRQSAANQLGNTKGALPAGVDVRGAGGYVIAPGTVLADGRQYEGFGLVQDAPDLPDWLVTAITTKPATARAPIAPIIRPSGGDFFHRVNQRAIGSLSLWVPSLFGPAARGTPQGYRVSSRALGRNLQEDLSIATTGIVDFGVHDMGDAQEGKRTPIDLALEYGQGPDAKAAAFWLCGQMGVAPSAMGWEDEYDVTTIDYEASARILASFKSDDHVDPDTGEVGAASPSPIGAIDQFDFPDSLMQPQGLVGDLADWICDWTSEPIRLHAIGAALVIVGTLLGRKVYSRTRPTSTALYIGSIAPSGMGKQHPQDCIRVALDAAGAPQMHMGWNVSLPAIVVALQQQAAKVMVADEFADKLIGLRNKNASTSQTAISEGLRTIWGTNTGTYAPDISISRGDGKIMRPALSFYGAATVKDFTRSLVSKDITNGLFNRFLILPRFAPIEKRAEPDGVVALPEALKDRLSWLNNCVAPLHMALAARGDGYPPPILIPFDDDAIDLNEVNKRHQQAMLEQSDQDDALMLWGRFAEQVKRVALIVACGRRPDAISQTSITAPDMAFATALVRYSIDQFIVMVRRDMVESWVQAQHKLVLGIVRAAGTISRNDLVRKIDGRIQRKPLGEIIASLVEGQNVEALKAAPGPKGGPPRELFRWVRD